MFHSRAKPHNIEKFIERLESADACLCNAALCNVLTKTSDRRLRDILHIVRREIEDAKKEAEGRGSIE